MKTCERNKGGNVTLKVLTARTTSAVWGRARYLCPMRFRLLLLLLPVLLGACSKTAAPVRLDFIGSTALVSGSRTATPNEDLSTRAYAFSNDNALKRLTISVAYDPGLMPILYTLPLSSYDPSNGPGAQTIVYLDSLIAPVATTNSAGHTSSEYLFQNEFSARATSGTEQWQYTVTDNTGERASRAYRLTVRKGDSAAVFHNYTTVIRPVPASTPAASDSVRNRARVFLNLYYGLLLPKYAVLNQEHTLQQNQQLVDLICTAQGTSVALTAPADVSFQPYLRADVWPTRRATELRRTTLTATNFANASTAALLDAAFGNGLPFFNTTGAYSTGTLGKGQVLAFRTVEGKTGLLLVSDLTLGSAPSLTCSVRVQK
ncbi:MAG: hypothetical protein JWR44_3537 [Hymenobacter sp.]|jgi:hypothetical protein|nr:hypothetical protein [Hymenobacter sp.]